MNETAATSERPVPITIICIIGFIGAAITIPIIFTATASNIGAWYPPYLAFTTVVGLICMVGLWKMLKWSVFAYTAFVILNQCVLMALGAWTIFALLIPAVVIVIGFMYLPKMK